MIMKEKKTANAPESFKEIFETHYTWIEGFNRNVRRYYDRLAMIDPKTNRQWTYKELDNEVNRLANSLVKDGFGKGDVIMVMTQNCPEFAFAYVAPQKIRGVMSPVSFRLSPGELAENLEDSKPKVILFDEKRKATVLQAVKIAGLKPRRLIVSDGVTDGDVISYHDYVEEASNREPVCEGTKNIYDETTRLYTSGTTGRPKGVPLTSINEVLSAHDIMIHFPMSFKDVTMNTTPWFHRGGVHCGGPCPTFYAGATLVVMGKFDADTTLRYVSRYHITFVIGVPTVLEELSDVQEKKDYDLSSLTGIITMGSPLERSACLRYQRLLTPNIYNGYGTTETLWNTFLRPFDLPEYAGTAAWTVDKRGDGEMLIEGVQKDGDNYVVNTTATTGEKYWKQISGAAGSNLGITEENLYDATNVRLRNISVSYNLPRKLLAKQNVFQSIKVGVSCTNVLMLYSKMHGLDPESIYATSTNAIGFEYGAAPTSRAFVFNVSFGF